MGISLANTAAAVAAPAAAARLRASSRTAAMVQEAMSASTWPMPAVSSTTRGFQA